MLVRDKNYDRIRENYHVTRFQAPATGKAATWRANFEPPVLYSLIAFDLERPNFARKLARESGRFRLRTFRYEINFHFANAAVARCLSSHWIASSSSVSWRESRPAFMYTSRLCVSRSVALAGNTDRFLTEQIGEMLALVSPETVEQWLVIVLHSFIHSYSFNRQVDITQLQTDREKAITLYS